MAQQPGAPQQPDPWRPPEAGPPPIPPAPGAQGGPAGAEYGGYAGYGYPGYGGQQPYAPPAFGYDYFRPPPPQGLSVASMVLGILGCVLLMSCWGAFGTLIASTVGLVLAIRARRGIAAGTVGGRSQATAGFVLNIIALALSVVLTVFLVLLFTVFKNDIEDSDPDYTYDSRGTVVQLVA